MLTQVENQENVMCEKCTKINGSNCTILTIEAPAFFLYNNPALICVHGSPYF